MPKLSAKQFLRRIIRHCFKPRRRIGECRPGYNRRELGEQPLPNSSPKIVDMHSEVLVYLIRCGFRVEEVPIKIRARERGLSMYSLVSYVTYPFRTGLMACLGWLAASLRRAGKG